MAPSTTSPGTIVVAEDPTQSTVEVVANAASVTTGTTDRDNHLRSPDFLDAENHPEIVFKSKRHADNDRWRLTGDLTVRGVTKPVAFTLTFEGEVEDPYGNTKAAFTAIGDIDREVWGLTWNVPLEGGGVLVSKSSAWNSTSRPRFSPDDPTHRSPGLPRAPQ